MRLTLGFLALVLACGASFADDMVVPQVVKDECGLYAYRAEITEVYDGDTVTADVDLGFNTWRRDEKLRLFGIDAPEVRGEARPAGLISRDALRVRILGKQVIICTIKDKTGKYGRYLAEIWLGDENINKWLLSADYATPYPRPVAQSSLWDFAVFRPRFKRAPFH